MMQKRLLTLILLVLVASTAGCAYRYYLGMHGPSTRNYPDIHKASIKEDAQCLACHAPKDKSGGAPTTPHPDFKGCLKCHNDPVDKKPQPAEANQGVSVWILYQLQ